MTARARALDLLAGRETALLARVAGVACADRELDGLAASLTELVLSATGFASCELYVLDDEERTLERAGATPLTDGPPAPVLLGEGFVGWCAAHGMPRAYEGGMVFPVQDGRDRTLAVVRARTTGGAPCSEDDISMVDALAALFAPVVCSARRLRTAREREHSAEEFAERAVEAQEAERGRLAREIHDGIAQRLASLGFHLSAALRVLPPAEPSLAEARRQILVARRLCDLASAETRAAIGGLRPPVLDDLGLPAALAGLAREADARQSSLDVTVTVTGELDAPLPDHLQTALYRIAQEAVGNILRHAEASTAGILLEYERDRVRLTVGDDGGGFHPHRPAPGSYGLRGMAERAELLGGRMTLQSRPGEGTTVRAVLPLR
ncbi:GAF domain-containing sensor histidine kinase [Actinocorallia populi]|uniref:GAF domain-containing sensor histidine kinase n=1 Tax=Actinocorallia populi TaxID=2079200 RepID=UPI000D087FCC|nr:sensor histidine kinase [Actinocorallia populi]